MKTQIESLVNGAPEVIRNENHEKYLTAKPGTCGKYAGTPRAAREEIALRVKEENQGRLRVVIAGVDLELDFGSSLSGKTWWWSHTLTKNEAALLFKALHGVEIQSYTYEQKYDVTITGDCRVFFERSSRKSALAMWRKEDSTCIGEEFVEIVYS